MEKAERPIDIIVPVYRGLADVRRCLESVRAARGRAPFELIVINDCSPEPEVTALLRGLTGITLLENQSNLGFVQTVNRGMALHPDRELILLNSDTEVAGDWIDRMVACAQRDSRIGTVTPFSNNATIASYPRFCETNALPSGMTTESLDRLFREVNRDAPPVDLPTAVGFCMLIRRKCLKEIGLFDAESFGRGYGEENDFCMRALKKGWRNVLSPNVFVRHVGGVSFGATQKAQMATASETLGRLHPDYNYRVSEHFRADPARPYRLAADLVRLQRSPLPTLLFTNHNLGGGTLRHIDDLVRLLEGRAHILLLRPEPAGIRTELSWLSPNEALKLHFTLPQEYAKLLELLRSIGISRIHFHHFLGIDPAVRGLPRDLGIPYDLTFHDFLMACPRIHLTTPDPEGERYCGEPDETGCNECLARAPATGARDIRAWREDYRPVVESSARVFVPSRFVEERVKRYFPRSRIVAVAHLDAPAEELPPVRSASASGVLQILVLGSLDQKKGAKVLMECADEASRTGLPLEFHLRGKLTGIDRKLRERLANFTDHGPYDSDDALVALLQKKTVPVLAWFPTLCPETYSYTLSIALRAGLPVLAPRLGAFIERLDTRPGSWLQPPTSSPQDWLQAMLRTREADRGPSAPRTAPLSDRGYREAYLEAAERPLPVPEASVLIRQALAEESSPAGARGWLRSLIVSLRYSRFLAPIACRIPTGMRVWVRNQIARGR